jgi:Mn-dependent DtxR family transcriptional regulator
MQISRNVIVQGIAQGNRKAFLTLLRLKMMYPHGWVKHKPEVIADTLSMGSVTVRRHLKKLVTLGFVEVTPKGKYFLMNLDWEKKPLENYQRILRKKNLFHPILSTVRITMEMCDKEILAHLAAKPAARYFNTCEYLRSLKEDNELMHNGERPKHHHPKKVSKHFMNEEYVSPLNEKIVISDKKMADRLGITVKDFRRNVKPMWRNIGLVNWSSSLVNLKIPEFKFGLVPKGVFFHKGLAYAHTTQYHTYPAP